MSDTPAANAAVLVIDLQTGMFNGVLEPVIHDAERLTERTRAVIAWARAGGRPLAFVRHAGPAGDPLAPGEPGWPVWPALGQAEGEPTFEKTVGDAFSDPSLGAWIDAHGAQEVILLGAQSEHCVAATTGGALARGLAVTVVGDAHSTWPWNGETAEEVIDRQNHAFAEAGAKVVTTAELTGG
ncbi:MAG TPA: isochorismatase family protein [Caulobacteraceae bacterium]